jgi:lipopolysaccharide export system protein LptC
MVVAVLAWPQFRAGKDRFLGRSSEAPSTTTETAPPIPVASDSVVNATYSGLDDEGRPFSITAKQLATSAEDVRRIDLTHPTAELVMHADRRLSLVADAGVYDKDAKSVDLIGSVVLTDEGGYRVTTTRAMIEFVDRNATGNEPVRAEGRMGTVTGAGFRVSGKNDSILVYGPARVVLNGAQSPRNPR